MPRLRLLSERLSLWINILFRSFLSCSEYNNDHILTVQTSIFFFAMIIPSLCNFLHNTCYTIWFLFKLTEYAQVTTIFFFLVGACRGVLVPLVSGPAGDHVPGGCPAAWIGGSGGRDGDWTVWFQMTLTVALIWAILIIWATMIFSIKIPSVPTFKIC